jgi:hypothetical protein
MSSASVCRLQQLGRCEADRIRKYPDPTAQVAKNDPQYRASVNSLKQVNLEIEELKREYAAPTQALMDAAKLIGLNAGQEAKIRTKIADAQQELAEQQKKTLQLRKNREGMLQKGERVQRQDGPTVVKARANSQERTERRKSSL